MEGQGIQLSPYCINYAKLLFFQHAGKLNEVYYEHFVDAYSGKEEQVVNTEENIEDYDEEEKANVVRECLKVISAGLQASGLTLKQAFKYSDGILYPEDFIAGLRGLGITNIDKQVLFIFIDQLQSDRVSELCIDFRYMKNLMQNYLPVAYMKSFVEDNLPKEIKALKSRSLSDVKD